MVRERGPWFFEKLGGGWRYTPAADGSGTYAVWKYNFTCRPAWLAAGLDVIPLGARLGAHDYAAVVERERLIDILRPDLRISVGRRCGGACEAPRPAADPLQWQHGPCQGHHTQRIRAARARVTGRSRPSYSLAERIRARTAAVGSWPRSQRCHCGATAWRPCCSARNCETGPSPRWWRSTHRQASQGCRSRG